MAKFSLPKIPGLAGISKLGMDQQSKYTLAILAFTAVGIQLYFSLINWAGNFGGIVGSFLRVAMGRGAIFIPLLCFVIAILLIRIQRRKYEPEELNGKLFWGTFFMIWAICGYLNLFTGVKYNFPSESEFGGGFFGFMIYPIILGFFGEIGGFAMLFFLWAFGFFLFSQLTPYDFINKLGRLRKEPELFWDFIPDILEFWRNQTAEPEKKDEVNKTDLNVPLHNQHIKVPEPKRHKTMAGSVSLFSNYSNDIMDNIVRPGQILKLTGQKVEWKFPIYSLLKDAVGEIDPGDVEENKKIITSTLKDFSIDIEIKDFIQGPTVSQYSFKPSSGVKLSSIEGLQSNLALELASTIRLETPIPGKSLVGLELPNKVKSTVRLKPMVSHKDFTEFKGDLPLAVGMDIAGKNLIYSLAKMPHLLVAGSTGSGKSVWINSMLLCLLYHYSPLDLQLVLVDMKRVELKLYDKVPHLLSPVITSAEKAINALKWTVLEMERRYKLLEDQGKRNIVDFNAYVRLLTPEVLEETGMGELPYIVFVIDELGDLMMLAKNEVEPIIVRLTQMSRAVGIHLVLGTQRPDTQVVTGLIKANIPSRIAFAVASGIDSRVILDQTGAEKLLGMGDGLFMSPSTMKAVRFQGAFVEESEVKKVVDFVKSQVGENAFLSNEKPEVTEAPKTKINVPGLKSSGSNDDMENAGDEVYEAAKEFAFSKGYVSTSALQTALGIGYPRARKFIQNMEEDGFVGPPNGSKPRDVFPPEDWLE